MFKKKPAPKTDTQDIPSKLKKQVAAIKGSMKKK